MRDPGRDYGWLDLMKAWEAWTTWLGPRDGCPSLSGPEVGLHIRPDRLVRGGGPRACKPGSNRSALPAGPSERGGPPPLLGLSPGLCGLGVDCHLN